MPKRAIDDGSGMAVVVIMMVSVIPVALPEKLNEPALIGGALADSSKVKRMCPAETALKVAVMVSGPGAGGVPTVRIAGRDSGLRARLVIGATVGVYVTERSVNVPVAPAGKENTTSVVTSYTVPAWLGVVNATLASKPAARVIKNDRLRILNCLLLCKTT
jgi:hypothetical protein